ncbi:phosphatidylcholine--retinol O-acyltransferase, partial [Acinetobacter baumannii]
MQQTNKRYPLGAHLIVKHLGYSHHGIYAGIGTLR